MADQVAEGLSSATHYFRETLNLLSLSFFYKMGTIYAHLSNPIYFTEVYAVLWKFFIYIEITIKTIQLTRCAQKFIPCYFSDFLLIFFHHLPLHPSYMPFFTAAKSVQGTDWL